MAKADWSKVDREIQAGNLAGAIDYLEEGLREAPDDSFRSLLDSTFSNATDAVAHQIEAFRTACEQSFPVRSLYLEMNGFDINPDRWYFDYFAYDVDVHEQQANDADCLCDWKSESWPSTTLHGLETVQEDYARYHKRRAYENPEAALAASYATPLVMCRFAELIGKAVHSRVVNFRIPILATAHDFDIIPAFLPVAL